MNVKDFPPSSGRDPVRCREVWVDDQRVMLLLVRRECNYDQAWVGLCVFLGQVLYFLYGSSSSDRKGINAREHTWFITASARWVIWRDGTGCQLKVGRSPNLFVISDGSSQASLFGSAR